MDTVERKDKDWYPENSIFYGAYIREGRYVLKFRLDAAIPDDPWEITMDKWWTIYMFYVEGPGATEDAVIVDGDVKTCGLCRAFRNIAEADGDCCGCPIYHAVGKQYCEATPYVEYDEWVERGMPGRARDAAWSELRFLMAVKHGLWKPEDEI